MNGVLGAIRRDLEGEGRFASLIPVPLANRFIRRVEEALHAVREAGYTTHHARMGGRHEHANAHDQARADQLVRALNNLTEQLRDVLDEVVLQSSSLEAQRINDALQSLFRNHKKSIAEEAQQVVQKEGLQLTLVIPDSTFSPAELRTRLNFRARDLSETLQRSEQVQEGYLKVQIGTKKESRVIPRERQSWWQWLFSWVVTPTEEVEVPVFEDRPNIVTRTFTQLLTAAELENEWATMVRQQQPELVRQCMNWLKEETLEVAESIREFQENLMNEYRKELEKVHETARTMTEEEEKAWEKALAAVKRLESKFQELLSWQ